MRNAIIVVIIGLVFVLYGTLNYYIGTRGWQYLGRYVPFLNSKIYWVFFWFIAFSYISVRFVEKFLPFGLHRILTLVGAYWLAAMFYFILILTTLDLLRFLNSRLGILPQGLTHSTWFAPVCGLVVLFAVAGILAYGTWNARTPQVTRYEVSIPKQAGNLRQLRVAVVADLHLGTLVTNERLTHMVDMINDLNPDLVLMPGDIFDEDVEPAAERDTIDIFGRIQSRYGVFAVPGNHEYIGGYPDKVMSYLSKAGIHVLRDGYAKVGGSFYVVGRDDRSGSRYNGRERKELAAIIQGMDRSLPVILLDHQPVNLNEAREQGIDLQLSGHTHRGQLFPNHLITRRLYEEDWGHLSKDAFQLIVTSGVATWGPPIRTSGKSEVVEAIINFGRE